MPKPLDAFAVAPPQPESRFRLRPQVVVVEVHLLPALEVPLNPPVPIPQRIIPAALPAVFQLVHHLTRVAREWRRRQIDDLGVRAGDQSRHQRVLLIRGESERLINHIHVTRKATTRRLRPSDELDALPVVETLEPFLTVSVGDLHHHAVNIDQRLGDNLTQRADQRTHPPERFHRRLVLVSRPDDQFLTENQEPRQRAGLTQTALTVLACHPLAILVATPLTIHVPRHHQLDRITLPLLQRLPSRQYHVSSIFTDRDDYFRLPRLTTRCERSEQHASRQGQQGHHHPSAAPSSQASLSPNPRSPSETRPATHAPHEEGAAEGWWGP